MSYNPAELEGKTASELHQRRAEIITRISALPRSYEDATTEELQELAFITGALRRKNSGPPKVARISRRSEAPRASTSDIAGLFE